MDECSFISGVGTGGCSYTPNNFNVGAYTMQTPCYSKADY